MLVGLLELRLGDLLQVLPELALLEDADRSRDKAKVSSKLTLERANGALELSMISINLEEVIVVGMMMLLLVAVVNVPQTRSGRS